MQGLPSEALELLKAYRPEHPAPPAAPALDQTQTGFAPVQGPSPFKQAEELAAATEAAKRAAAAPKALENEAAAAQLAADEAYTKAGLLSEGTPERAEAEAKALTLREAAQAAAHARDASKGNEEKRSKTAAQGQPAP